MLLRTRCTCHCRPFDCTSCSLVGRERRVCLLLLLLLLVLPLRRRQRLRRLHCCLLCRAHLFLFLPVKVLLLLHAVVIIQVILHELIKRITAAAAKRGTRRRRCRLLRHQWRRCWRCHHMLRLNALCRLLLFALWLLLLLGLLLGALKHHQPKVLIPCTFPERARGCSICTRRRALITCSWLGCIALCTCTCRIKLLLVFRRICELLLLLLLRGFGLRLHDFKQQRIFSVLIVCATTGVGCWSGAGSTSMMLHRAMR